MAVGRAFRLMRVSGRVLNETPSLFGVIFVGVVGSTVVSLGSFYLVLGRWPDHSDMQWPNYLVALPLLWLGSYVATFCNAVVVATASLRMRGEPATVRDGLVLALARLPRLLAWVTVSMTVGILLHALAERFKLGGAIARWLFDMAWALATVFVVPVLVVEDVGVARGIKRSSVLFRERWGETVTGLAGTSLAVFLAGLALAPIIGLVALVSVPFAIAAGVALLLAIIVASSAFDAVLRTSLYHYAVDGSMLGPLQSIDLDDVWVAKT